MFASLNRRAGASFLLLALMPLTARAGMTIPVFTEIARARFQVISFFLVLYLALAFIYQILWNSLSKDFPKLPRIRYRGALGALAVCGLFIYVILTMISGARELMTPGAWSRSGIFYTIREPEKDPKPWLDTARRLSLESLRGVLWHYSEQHGGAFPISRDHGDIPVGDWNSIDPNGLPLVYVPGLKPDTGKDVLAYEPGTFGATRFVLLSDGEIVQMSEDEVNRRLQQRIDEMDSATQKKRP
jgi:hypothetical protein